MATTATAIRTWSSHCRPFHSTSYLFLHNLPSLSRSLSLFCSLILGSLFTSPRYTDVASRDCGEQRNHHRVDVRKNEEKCNTGERWRVRERKSRRIEKEKRTNPSSEKDSSYQLTPTRLSNHPHAPCVLFTCLYHSLCALHHTLWQKLTRASLSLSFLIIYTHSRTSSKKFLTPRKEWGRTFGVHYGTGTI